jgi:hypothetical protein
LLFGSDKRTIFIEELTNGPGFVMNMATVLISPKEVLVIMIITALLVFVIMVRRKRR